MKFDVADIRDLSRFDDSSFDIIFCVGTIIYMNFEDMKKALEEFKRVCKPNGILLILFQKSKGALLKTVRFLANVLPFGLYAFLVNICAFICVPFISLYVKRKINLSMARYLLLGLRNIHFGIPVNIPGKFKVITVTTEQCSEASTASYKIIFPEDKRVWDE